MNMAVPEIIIHKDKIKNILTKFCIFTLM